MKTLKKQFKQENIDSNNLRIILTNYSRKKCVKVALYAAEDCFHIKPSEENEICIDLVKKWLNKTSVTKRELRTAYAADSASIYYAAYAGVANSTAAYAADSATYYAARSFGGGPEKEESKYKEYCSYARLFAYQDPDFPHKDFAKTFNLDNPTDLNIFLDFLTDNYPEAITYPREEYFINKLAKEYLKVIYQ